MKESMLIKPSRGWKLVNLKEIYRYRDLLYFLTIRGIKAKYAQSVLGIGWAIIQPLFTSLVFTLVFGNLAKVDSRGIPYLLFSYSAMVPWLYFSNTLNESSNSLIANANMITKVYFARLVLPLSAGLSKFLDFLIGFVLLIGLVWYYGFTPGIGLIVLPMLLLILLMASLGLGTLLSALSLQYRDVKHAMSFLVQLMMYGSPVVYSTYMLPESYQTWFAINPMVGVIEGFRAIFLNQPIPWSFITTGFVSAFLILLCGLFVFKRMERSFADMA